MIGRQQLSLLIGVLCVGSIIGQKFNQCSFQQRCVEFNSCPEFKAYVGKPATTWPRAVQEQVLRRICNKQQRTYYVCCSSPINVGFDPVPYPGTGSSGRPTGLKLLDMTSCGKHTKDRIAYGKNAKVFEFPWMALLIGFDGELACGGTLIAESYVLTAAHCKRRSIVKVRLGENDILKKIDCNVYEDEDDDCADPPQDIAVAEFIAHSLYSPSKRKNDIALIRLASPAKLSHSVKTVCLPIGSMVRNPEPTDMLISGWGLTENNKVSNILQYAKVSTVPLEQCNRQLSLLDNTIQLDGSQVCASGKNKVDNCAGDSGGPMQYSSLQSTIVQYGIVSFGLNSCGVTSSPGVYTKVSHYIDWIVENLK
uniref:Putative trypsin-like serine protease n=1 Tax=Culex tarsalis TaxID=7177 RepID=A0A1Q3FL86_CULTA